MRTRSILLLLLCLPLSVLFGKGFESGELPPSNAVPTKINSVEHWLAAEVLEDQTMTVMMNQTQQEFWEFVENNEVDRITIDFFWKSKDGNEIGKIATTVLNDFYNTDFSIDNWFFPLETVDTVNRIYLAQVALDDAECGPKVELPLLDQFEEEEEDLPIELPDYKCGDPFTYEELDITPLADVPKEGDIWFIGGFPILLGTVSETSPYSGTGIIPLPFQNKVVSVTFDALTVNNKYQVVTGEVETVKGNLADYPNFDVPRDTLTIGGEICVDLPDEDATAEMERVYGPEGLDALGFDSTGYNHFTMSRYDSLGFDFDGYDQSGCNSSQLNRAGETCQNHSPTSPEAAAYAEEQKDSIQQKIAAILAALLKEKQDSLALVNCGDIRTDLLDLVNRSDVDRATYFGENDEYLLKGLSKAFLNKPEPLANAVFRDSLIIKIETAHIGLYGCDKILGDLETTATFLQELAVDATVLETILAAIKNWSVEEYNEFSTNPEKLKLWLTRQIEILLEAKETSINGTTSIWQQDSPFHFPANGVFDRNALYANQLLLASQKQQNLLSATNGYKGFVYDHGPSTAATAAIGNSVFNEDFTVADASFELLQGAEYINGVHRIHYIAALARQISMNPETEGTNLLPFSIDKTIGGKSYGIIIDNIVFSPNGAVLDAYALVEDPNTGKKVGFRAYGIGFGPTGITGDSKLSLLGVDVSIRLNNVARLYIKGTEDTYVAWDCDGFSHFGIDAEVEICRRLITPLDPQTLDTVEGDENYFIPLKIGRVEGWLEFHATVSAPPFALTKAQDIKWKLSEMVLDFSSSETPEFTPLMGYTSPFYDEATKVMAPQWKGFYMKHLSVELPKTFTKTELGEDGGTTTQTDTLLTNIEANDILIDDCGFTGQVSVEREVISLDKGNLDGWAFSVNGFEFKVIKTSFAGAGLKGKIKVPIFDDPMSYEAVIYPNDQYSFTVALDSAITAPLFLADVTLEKDSEIQVGKTDGKFIAKAILNGRLDISADSTRTPIKPKFKGVCFEGFEVSNVAPYFSPGVWGLHSSAEDKNDAGGFPIRLSEIRPYKGEVDEKIGLALGIDLILGDTTLGLNASGKMRIKAKLADDNGRQKWEFDGVKLDSLTIDASFPGVERLRGYLSFYGEEDNPDPKWGVGFRGLLDVQFKGFKVDLKAASQFGKKEDYKYFFVDAMVNFTDGIPIGPSFTMKGFGGGASMNLDIVEEKIDFSATGTEALPGIGESFSGTVYAPDKSKGLGIKASLAFATAGKKSVFDGYASLSMLFNDNNGIDQMTLKGNGEFLAEWDVETLKTFKNAPKYESDAKEPPAKIKSPFSAFVSLNFNFNEPSFHGLLNVFLIDPSGTVEGSGIGGKVVDAVLHFDPNKWYIWVGRTLPEHELAGLVFKLPFVGSANGGAYFQIGTQTDPMLPLPAEVREIAYKINDNKTLRTSGAGMVFGGRVNVEMEAEIKKIIKTRLAAGLGFDVMIRQYKGVSCLETGDNIGINGWYGSGQAYFYAIGSLEIAGINLAELGVAGVLQLRLPNPIFAQATLGMKLKIGILKINGSLALKLGEDCTLVSDDPNQALGMDIIARLSPGDEEGDVPTNQHPEVFFNLPLEKDFSVFDLNQTEQVFRAELIQNNRQNGLFDGNGASIPYTWTYNEDKTSIKLIPLNTFDGNDSITFRATVQIYRNGVRFTEEEKEVTFATGEALDYIPESNIAYAYPVDGMTNFFKQQHPAKIGYIQLVSGQANLFSNLPAGTKQQVRITNSNGSEQLVDFTYDETNRRISYPLDPAFLQNGHLYKVDVLKTTGDQEVATNSLAIPNTADNSFATERSDDAVYTAYFRTSEYDRFEDKIRAIGIESENPPTNDFGRPTVATYNNINVSEKFDDIEINGSGNIPPLVSFKVDLDNQWIQQEIKPFLENFNIANPCEFIDFPKEGLEEGAGITGGISGEANATAFDEGSFNAHPFVQNITLDLEGAVNSLVEFADQARIECTGTNIESQLLICREEGKTEQECTDLIGLTQVPYPAMRRGEYKVSAKYQLPGISAGGTSILYFEKD